MYYIQPALPYSLPLSLKRLTDMPRQIIGRVENETYVRAVAMGDRLGLVRIRAEGEGLALELEGDLDPARVAAQVRYGFGLDLDLAGFYRHVGSADPVMARIVHQYPGARPIGPFDPWESLIWAVISQQINIRFAYTLLEGLVNLGGRACHGYPAFPGPETVARMQYEQLQAAKYNRSKAEYIIDLARLVVGGGLDLAAVIGLPFAEAMKELTKLRGVGCWTAECVLMDAGVTEAFPAGDIGIRNAVQQFYGLDHQPVEGEVRAIGQVWAPYSALACYYLWMGLLDKG